VRRGRVSSFESRCQRPIFCYVVASSLPRFPAMESPEGAKEPKPLREGWENGRRSESPRRGDTCSFNLQPNHTSFLRSALKFVTQMGTHAFGKARVAQQIIDFASREVWHEGGQTFYRRAWMPQ
jgi:hypothetical protein